MSDVEREWSFVYASTGKRVECASEDEARKMWRLAKGRIEWRTTWRDYQSAEPMLPVSDYCTAMFIDWPRSLRERLAEPDCSEYERTQWEPVVAAFDAIYPLPILKSNYLARRIYGGEPHRIEKCPVHKGHWSGCYPPDTEDGSCECVSGMNTTGWLPPKEITPA